MIARQDEAARPRLGLSVTRASAEAVLVGPDGDVRDSARADVRGSREEAIGEVLATVTANNRAGGPSMVGLTLSPEGPIGSGPLGRVGVLRLGGAISSALPPFAGWKRVLAERIAGPVRIIEGGPRHDGTFTEVDLDAVEDFAAQCMGTVQAIAVSGALSTVAPQFEDAAVRRLRELFGESVPIVMSGRRRGSGLLERENTAIIDAALVRESRRSLRSIGDLLRTADIPAQVFVIQNDGSAVIASTLEALPTRTLESRLGAAVRGGGIVSGLTDAIIVDTDPTAGGVGLLRDGQVVLESVTSMLYGARLDHAVPFGLHRVESDTALSDGLRRNTPDSLEDVVRQLHRQFGALDVITVGRGVEQTTHGSASTSFAAAIGAATADVAAESWTIVQDSRDYDDDLERASKEAIDLAIAAGADPRSVRIASVDEFPISYTKHISTRLRVRVSGPPHLSDNDLPRVTRSWFEPSAPQHR